MKPFVCSKKPRKRFMEHTPEQESRRLGFIFSPCASCHTVDLLVHLSNGQSNRHGCLSLIDLRAFRDELKDHRGRTFNISDLSRMLPGRGLKTLKIRPRFLGNIIELDYPFLIE